MVCCACSGLFSSVKVPMPGSTPLAELPASQGMRESTELATAITWPTFVLIQMTAAQMPHMHKVTPCYFCLSPESFLSRPLLSCTDAAMAAALHITRAAANEREACNPALPRGWGSDLLSKSGSGCTSAHRLKQPAGALQGSATRYKWGPG